ncbi:MAG TPA: DNA polymerase III subunit chi [Steroidobacteraceae bacterium]|nr:DNA polymerase III subunit chi [Steroidobacteraceae bacterium]
MEEQSPQVSFYVLGEASAGARLQLVCRLADKAYRAGQSVLIWHSDPRELAALDELLWTFGDDRTFLPHEVLSDVTPHSPAAEGTTAEAERAPVLLSTAPVPAGAIGVLINLSPSVPPFIERAARVLEIIDGDATRRQDGRARFKAYRERGLSPVSHQLRGG